MKFYHLFIEDYQNNIVTDYGYFKDFFKAWRIAKKYNDDRGNSSGNCTATFEAVRNWGTGYIGAFTITMHTFEDE